MLTKFGKMLKCVVLRLFFDEKENLAEYYLLLKKFLNYMPSLQKLEIMWCQDKNTDIQDNALAETIKINACSELKELETLSVDDRLPCQILNEVVRQNNGFKRLKLHLNYVQRLKFDFATPLPNLNSLQVAIELDKDFQRLKRFAKNWRLTSFCGMFRHFTKKKFWLEVYKMIEDNWGDTLEILCLHLPIVRELRPVQAASTNEMVFQITTDKRLKKMKALKRIEIVTGCAINLDFLLPCKETLEEIQINQLGTEKTNLRNIHYNYAMARQIVEYLGKEKEMQKSNIWELFPKLRVYKSFKTVVKRPA